MAATGHKGIDSAERILSLVALLTETSHPLTLEDIVNEMRFYYGAMSEGTRTNFERDKAVLRSLGMPITTQVLSGADAGKTAYSIDRSGYRHVNVGLTEAEMSALQEAAAMVRIGTTWGARAVRWLGGEIVEPGVVAARVDANEPVLPVLNKAVSEHRAAHFGYHGRARTVHPYGLLARGGFWYLVAFDTGRGEQVTFRVDRIEGEVTTGEPGEFERPADFSLATAYARDAKTFMGGAVETATVRIDARVAPAVVRELGDEAVVATLPDGSIDVEVQCGNRVGFYSWLFAMVDRAVVMGPENVRADVVARLESMRSDR